MSSTCWAGICSSAASATAIWSRAVCAAWSERRPLESARVSPVLSATWASSALPAWETNPVSVRCDFYGETAVKWRISSIASWARRSGRNP
jgi:hypothetical protein